MEGLGHVRDEMLRKARLAEGETVLDVGCGEGLIGFGALERGAAEVVFSDISTDLLDTCRQAARDLGVLDRCRFVQAPAEDLAPVANESIDVVTTRSVLIYVRDKASAFQEFARVLRPSGRISLFEPINRFASRGAPNTWGGYDFSAIQEIADKVRALYEALQPADTDPMLDFDERDLLALAEEAGFSRVHLQLEADISPTPSRRWDVFVNCAPNPLVPTFAEAMDQALDAEERERLTSHLRPLVEGGDGTSRSAIAYFQAEKQ